MKKYFALFALIALLAVNPLAVYAATGMGDGVVLDEQSATPSTPEAGKVHLFVDNTSTPVLKMVDDAGTATTLSSTAATSLDAAYNGGAKIDVDGDALELEVDNGSNNSALHIDHDEATNDNTAVLIENAADAANAITIDIDAQTTGRDIEGTGASWYVTGEGNVTCNNMAIGGTLAVTGATTLSGAIYQAAIASAASGNIALTVNASGNGTIGIGSISTGAVTITPATTIVGATDLTGALTANGACTLGDAAADDITITGDVVADIRLDDDTTNSPALQFLDASEYDWAILKVNGATGNLTVTSDAAASDFQIVTGNLKVGAGTEGVALNGEDAYVTGTFEVDGAVQLDGAATFNGTTAFTGATNTFTLGAAEYVVLDAATTDMTGTQGALDINFDSLTTTASAINVKATLLDNTGGEEVHAIVIDLDDDSDAAATLVGLLIDATDETGSSEIRGISFEDVAGADTGVDVCIHAELPATGKALYVDAEGTVNTGTAGVVDIDAAFSETASEAVNVKGTFTLNGAGEYASVVEIDVDDDTTAASFVTGLTIDASDATGSSTVRGLAFETQAGADTSLETCIVAQLPAAGILLDVDASGTAQTGTSGIIDIEYASVTNGAEVVNIDVDVGDAGAGVTVAGIVIDLDDDTSTNAATINGVSIQSSDLTGHANTSVTAYHTSGCDAAFQADNGYVRIGTGSTPGVTPGDDDLFVEGTVEVDGAARFDGALDVNSTITGAGNTTTTIAGMTSIVENYTGADNVITIAESGTTFTNSGDADGSQHTLPEASTCIGAEFTFLVVAAQLMTIEVDNADIIMHLTLDAGDKITSSTANDSITLRAVSSSQWMVVSVYPTAADWADGGA